MKTVYLPEKLQIYWNWHTQPKIQNQTLALVHLIFSSSNDFCVMQWKRTE